MKTLADVLRKSGERFDWTHAPSTAADKLQERREQPKINWQPLPGPQTEAYNTPADILFYGGAAGGGKTDLILGLALTAHHSSIIFRREFSQLRGAEGIIERSKEIVSGHGRLNEQVFLWRDLPGNRKLEFGAVQYEDHKNKYKGRAHDLKAFDEITEFSKSQFEFLIAWNRTTIRGQRCRVVCTGNPPTTAEGQWVTDFWGPWLDRQHPNPAMPGELRWFARIDGKDVETDSSDPIEHDGHTIKPLSRTFIPASISDNPYLMETGYQSVLASLPEPLRSQLLFGDFEAHQDDDPYQVIPTDWVRQAQKRWSERTPEGNLSALGVDPSRGGSDDTALARRYGNYFPKVKSYPGKDVPDGPHVAGLIVHELDGDLAAPVNLDVIGIGSSVLDSGKLLNLNMVALNGSEKSHARDKSGRLGFLNRRAEWWWKLREALDPSSGEDIELPPGARLLADLCAPKWKLSTRGIQIEAKDEIKKRIGRSPDEGEAVVYASVPDPPRVRKQKLSGL